MKVLFFKFLNNYFKCYMGMSIKVWLGLSAAFANAVCGGMTFLLSLYFVRHLGISVATAGTLISCFGVGAIFGSYVGGRLCDILPAYYVCITSLIVNGIALIIFAFLKSFHEYGFVLFIMGFANYSFSPSIRVWLMNNTFDQVRLRSINTLRMIVNLGMGFSVWICSMLATYKFEYAFYFCSFVLFLFALSLLLFGKNELFALNKDNAVERKVEHTNTTDKKIIWMVYSSVLLIGLIFSQLRVSYPLYLNEFYRLSAVQFGHVFIVNTLLIIFFQNFLLEMLSKINQGLLIGVGGLLIGLGMFFLIFGNTFWYAVILCIIWSIGEMMFFSTSQVLTYNKAKSAKKGKHMGIYQMIYATTNVLGPICGGLIYHHLGGNVVWYIAGSFGIVCFLFGIKIYFRDIAIFNMKFSHSL